MWISLNYYNYYHVLLHLHFLLDDHILIIGEMVWTGRTKRVESTNYGAEGVNLGGRQLSSAENLCLRLA